MSKNFDDYIRDQLSKEENELPVSVKNKIDKTLESLDERSNETVKEEKNVEDKKEDKVIDIKSNRNKRKYKSVYKRFGSMAAGIAFVFLFLFPNVSESYARTMEKIPVIGSIVKVITIRNYFYSDDTHELNVNVPQVDDTEDTDLNKINMDTEELTKKLVDEFYAEMDALGKTSHAALYVDYDVITDTENWFTLRLCVSEVKGSSDTYYKFYNLDKNTGNIVKLGDIALNDNFYSLVEEDIKKQMVERMEKDEMEAYWVEGDSFGEGFVKITPDHNYYWDKNGNLVIPFDKYEVSPGYMGTPEFTVERSLIKDCINSDLHI